MRILPFIGVYDVFSAIIASRYTNSLFISGYSFAASHYGMPDIGFITWTDIIDFTRRVRAILPDHHILVDIDDGYVDIETAKHVARILHESKASGIILEDQKRPKKCGHCNNKNILELDSYLSKLEAVITAKDDLFLVARTDAESMDEKEKRVAAFQNYNVDCILVDGISDVAVIKKFIHKKNISLAYNQIFGGKSTNLPLKELEAKGVNVAIYSTPCLFTAQKAIINALDDLKQSDFDLSKNHSMVTLNECNDLLNESLNKRES